MRIWAVQVRVWAVQMSSGSVQARSGCVCESLCGSGEVWICSGEGLAV